MITIHIPTPLRPFVDQQDKVEVEPKETVGDILSALIEQFPDLQKHLYNSDNELRKFVNIYLNEEDIRYMQGEATPAPKTATLSIIPSIAGGSA